MWVSVGLSLLVKGPLAFPVFVMVALMTAVAFKPARRISRMLPVLGPILALAIAAPWYVWIACTHPEAINLWYGHSVGRFGGQVGGEEHFYFYLVNAPMLWLPWPIAIAFGLYAMLRRRLPAGPGMLRPGAAVFLLAWAFGGLIALSLSKAKFTHYALTVTPAFLAFAGLGLDYLLFTVRRPLRLWGKGLLGFHMLAPLAAGAAAILVGPRVPAIAPILRDYALPIAVLGVAMGLLSEAIFWLYAVGRPRLAVAAFAAAALLMPMWYHELVYPILSRTDDSASAGMYIARHVTGPGDAALYRRAIHVAGRTTPLDAPAVFYADRPMPLILTLDDLRQWRAEHPEGCLLVHRDYLAEVMGEGPWKALEFRPDPLFPPWFFLLQPVPTDPAKEPPGALNNWDVP
jgi:4-amino-4-deoxy-L-arabinose transferase-like glycosyltransferase